MKMKKFQVIGGLINFKRKKLENKKKERKKRDNFLHVIRSNA